MSESHADARADGELRLTDTQPAWTRLGQFSPLYIEYKDDSKRRGATADLLAFTDDVARAACDALGLRRRKKVDAAAAALASVDPNDAGRYHDRPPRSPCAPACR